MWFLLEWLACLSSVNHLSWSIKSPGVSKEFIYTSAWQFLQTYNEEERKYQYNKQLENHWKDWSIREYSKYYLKKQRADMRKCLQMWGPRRKRRGGGTSNDMKLGVQVKQARRKLLNQYLKAWTETGNLKQS